jgi:hypothetical protein
MPVQINIRTDITLAEIAQKKQRGFMVEETPHIGNLSPSTLALLTLGLEAKLVDINIGRKDNLFYPHCVIVKGEKTQIAQPDVMTTHNVVTGQNLPVTDFHLRPLRDNGLKAFAHSDWIFRKKEDIFRIIQAITTPRTLNLWKRYVNQYGQVSGPANPGIQILDKIHKVTSPRNHEGWVIPNPLNILFDLVFGALESNTPDLYMLSGQSMYKYINQPYRTFGPMNQLISDLYDAATTNGFSSLPKRLTVNMVPIPVIRHFVAPSRLKCQLEQKLAYYGSLTAKNKRCAGKLSTGQLSYALMRRFQMKRKSVFTSLSYPLLPIIADSESGSFYSQHDLAADNDTIYIPDRVMDMPIGKMLDIVAKMNRLMN